MTEQVGELRGCGANLRYQRLASGNDPVHGATDCDRGGEAAVLVENRGSNACHVLGHRSPRNRVALFPYLRQQCLQLAPVSDSMPAEKPQVRRGKVGRLLPRFLERQDDIPRDRAVERTVVAHVSGEPKRRAALDLVVSQRVV